MTDQAQIVKPKKIIFGSHINREVINFSIKEKYKMQGGEGMSFSEADAKKIAEICLQTNTYEILFRKRLNGKAYTEKDAREFIDWIKKGWSEQTHFVFLVRKIDSEIIGAIDIKSANLDRAEIGYWADENYRGFMTNATNELVSLSIGAGFKKLFAVVRSDNSKSIGVLERTGFKKIGDKIDDDGTANLEYEKQL